jgi:hypothetical protein
MSDLAEYLKPGETPLQRIERDQRDILALVKLLQCKAERIQVLTAELKAATGYMRNAMIDLETGATKATALRTIKGGIARAERALTPDQ